MRSWLRSLGVVAATSRCSACGKSARRRCWTKCAVGTLKPRSPTWRSTKSALDPRAPDFRQGGDWNTAGTLAGVWRKVLTRGSGTWARLAQAVGAGAGVTVASVVLYFPVLWLWRWLFDHPTELASEIAFAQVYTGFASLFLTSALGLFVILEFFERQARPALDLRFELARLNQPAETGTYVVSLVLENRGSAVAVWYMLQFSVGFLPNSLTSPFEQDGPVRPVVGAVCENWRS